MIEFCADPAVPPIPPHATRDQMIKAAESIVRGDSDRHDMIKEVVRSKLAEIERAEATAYTVPRDAPEADGTFSGRDHPGPGPDWADGEVGTGWTYRSLATAALIRQTLAPMLIGRPVSDIGRVWADLRTALRNIDYPGVDRWPSPRSTAPCGT